MKQSVAMHGGPSGPMGIEEGRGKHQLVVADALVEIGHGSPLVHPREVRGVPYLVQEVLLTAAARTGRGGGRGWWFYREKICHYSSLTQAPLLVTAPSQGFF